MDIVDSKKTYKAPQSRTVEVNVQNILCFSDPSLTGWREGSNSEGDME